MFLYEKTFTFLTDTEAYSQLIQTSTFELFTNIIHGVTPLTTSRKSSVLDGQLGSEYDSEI